MRFSLFFVLLLMVFFIDYSSVDCQSSSSSSYVDFVMGSRGLTETWIIRAYGTVQINECRQRLEKGDSQIGFPNGLIGYSNESFSYMNYDINTKRIYHWYMKEGWNFADTSIELCDGRPTYIDDHLDEWIPTVKTYCPWGGFIKQELPPNHSNSGASSIFFDSLPFFVTVFVSIVMGIMTNNY